MNALREKIRTYEEYLMKGEIWLAIIMVAGMTLMSLVNMGLRNITGLGVQLSWAIDMNAMITHALPHLIILLGFLGASIGFTKREVIQMDVLKRNYPRKVRSIISFIAFLAMIVVIWYYTSYAMTYSDPSYVSEAGQGKWLRYGYVPFMALVLLKAVLGLVNPQIEQEMSGGADEMLAEAEAAEKQS